IAALSIIPGAPTLVSAAAAPGPVVHLAWTIPSNFTQSIEVDRKTGAGGAYAPIATLGGGVTSFDDTTVTAGQQYFYVVKAIDLAGTSPASNELSVSLPLPTIVANSIFYNGSAYDGQNGSSNQTDTNAVATDKQALLPGQTASFRNYTSYSKGINGIIIDVADLANLPRFEDFTFRVGNDNNPSAWPVAPAPTLINTYPGRGPNGSTQITIIWDDNVIQNQWLQVALLANGHTGLAADDVFYFGNAIGESGNSTADAAVDSADELAARSHGTGLGSAALDNPYDYNRDKLVNTQDQLIARSHRSGLFPLKLIAPPTAAMTVAASGVSAPTKLAPSRAARPAAPMPRPTPVSPPPSRPGSVFGLARVIRPIVPEPAARTAGLFSDDRTSRVWD
ncbi:MAG TPA: fibronectin type III domain-containing protein, partial [Tepidisphaeraceae bacterium]